MQVCSNFAPPGNCVFLGVSEAIGTCRNPLLIWWVCRGRRLPAPLAPWRSPTLLSRTACWGSIARWSPCSQAPPWLAGSAPPLCRSVVWGCSPLVDASFQAAPDLFDLDLQLGPRRLSGGPTRGHPFPVPSLQTPIGSLPLTGSASRRAMPLGSWMSRQSRVGPMNSKV